MERGGAIAMPLLWGVWPTHNHSWWNGREVPCAESKGREKKKRKNNVCSTVLSLSFSPSLPLFSLSVSFGLCVCVPHVQLHSRRHQKNGICSTERLQKGMKRGRKGGREKNKRIQAQQQHQSVWHPSISGQFRLGPQWKLLPF